MYFFNYRKLGVSIGIQGERILNLENLVKFEPFCIKFFGPYDEHFMARPLSWLSIMKANQTLPVYKRYKPADIYQYLYVVRMYTKLAVLGKWLRMNPPPVLKTMLPLNRTLLEQALKDKGVNIQTWELTSWFWEKLVLDMRAYPRELQYPPEKTVVLIPGTWEIKTDVRFNPPPLLKLARDYLVRRYLIQYHWQQNGVDSLLAFVDVLPISLELRCTVFEVEHPVLIRTLIYYTIRRILHVHFLRSIPPPIVSLELLRYLMLPLKLTQITLLEIESLNQLVKADQIDWQIQLMENDEANLTSFYQEILEAQKDIQRMSRLSHSHLKTLNLLRPKIVKTPREG